MTKIMVDGEVRDMTPEEEAELAASHPILIPSVVSMRQARLALYAAGLLDAVTASVQALGGALWIEWEYATEVRRDAPLVTELSIALGLTEAQLDALFTQAGVM